MLGDMGDGMPFRYMFLQAVLFKTLFYCDPTLHFKQSSLQGWVLRRSCEHQCPPVALQRRQGLSQAIKKTCQVFLIFVCLLGKPQFPPCNKKQMPAYGQELILMVGFFSSFWKIRVKIHNICALKNFTEQRRKGCVPILPRKLFPNRNDYCPGNNSFLILINLQV